MGSNTILSGSMQKQIDRWLDILFKNSQEDGLLPKEWGSANVSIFKKSDRQDFLNFKPVSLTNMVWKLLEM